MSNWRANMKPTARKALVAFILYLLAMPVLLFTSCGAKAQSDMVSVGTLPSGMKHFVVRSTLGLGVATGYSVFVIKALTSDGTPAYVGLRAINCYRDEGAIHFFTLEGTPVSSAQFKAKDGTLATAYVGAICALAILDDKLPQQAILEAEEARKGQRA